MKNVAMLFSAGVIGLATVSAQAGVVEYDFDSAEAYGKTIMVAAGNNILNPSGGRFTFDPSIKAEGDASFRMEGENGQTYGNLRITLDIGSISANETTQDLSGNDTKFTFKLRTDNVLGTLTNAQVLPDIRLFAGGTHASPDVMVARFYRTDLDDTADGQFVTIEQVIKDANGTLGPGYQSAAGQGDITKLNQVKFLQITYSYSGGGSVTANTNSFDVHVDDLQLSGPGVTIVPEPGSVMAASALSLLALCGRRRRSA